MKFSLGSNIDDFLTLNERGREIQSLLKRQQQQVEQIQKQKKVQQELQRQQKEQARSQSKGTAATQNYKEQPGHLGTVLDRALLKSTLASFLHDYNKSAGTITVETQLAMLDLLKFSYCKSGEAAAWDISAEIFPHIQFAINFIEKALKNKDKDADGKITLQYVRRRLTELDLHGKSIAYLDKSLFEFRGLRYLNLSFNLITSTKNFIMPPRLKYLNLEMNLLTNLLVRYQPALSRLLCLNLSRNRLSDSSNLLGLRCLPQLLALDLSYNEIHTLNTLWHVLYPFQLQSLDMIGNPCSVTADYAVNILHHLPELLYLDDVQVPDDLKPDQKEEVTEKKKDDVLKKGAEKEVTTTQAKDYADKGKGKEATKKTKDNALQKDTQKQEASKKTKDNGLQRGGKKQKVTKNAFQKGAELCFNFYRILKFKYVEPSLPSSQPSKVDLKRSHKKKEVRKSQMSPTPTLASPTMPSRVTKARTLAPSPPPKLKISTDVLYRIEIEVPILSKTLHDFVDFVILAKNNDVVIPSELLERTNLWPHDNVTGLSFPNISSFRDLFHDKESIEGMTVGKAKDLLASLKSTDRDAINQIFKTSVVTNALPEAPIMEFQPVSLLAPHDNLGFLSKMFYTQVKLHFVQIHVVSNKANQSAMPTVKSNRKMPKSKDSIQTKRTTKTSKNAEKKSDELEILQRTILHTIVLDQLREPTWAEKTHDFIWTREGLKKGEDLMDIIYIEEDISERKLKQLEKLAKGRELQRAPEELTIHFGISLKRTHHVADK